MSRLEQAGDALLSTLARHVEALGGELALVATFPDGVEARIEMVEVVEQREPVNA